MPDPKLLAAMEEIKAVVKKYDIGAFIMIQTPNNAEFLNALNASWLPLKWEKNAAGQMGVRITCKRADYPSKEAWETAMNNGVGFIMATADIMRAHLETFESLAKELGRRMTIEHMTKYEGGHE